MGFVGAFGGSLGLLWDRSSRRFLAGYAPSCVYVKSCISLGCPRVLAIGQKAKLLNGPDPTTQSSEHL